MSLSKSIKLSSKVSNGRSYEWQDHVKSFLPMVKKEVRIVVERLQLYEHRDDLLQAGLTGLIEAVKVYRPGTMALSGFVRFRIKGAIIDEVRRQDWRPRWVSKSAAWINRTITVLQQRLGRNPSDREIAQEMNIDLAEYFKLLDDVHLGQIDVLDFFPQALESFGLEGSAEQQQLKEEQVHLLAVGLSRLKLRESRILKLYYEHDLSMAEIGHLMQITEARVSQIHKQALLTLRAEVSNLQENSATRK